MSKIFGEFESIEDLNETAINLREAGEKEEIFTLGQENMIADELINKFIDGDIDYLVKPKEVTSEKICRVCGCTDNNACEGGCHWVEDNLCSKCEENGHKNETSVEKLKRQLGVTKINSVPAEPIVKYLLEKCNSDDLFSSRVLLRDKDLKECFNYVFSEVKKKLKSISGWIADEEVYKLAEDYYILDDIKIEDKAPEEIENTDNKATKEENKVTKNKEVKSKKDDRNYKLLKDKEVMNEGQVSLFDF